jgi:regulator of protease activity HflC (stomatin/prohibitin superfamily)
VNVECSFQFRVIKDEIPQLFQNFGLSYFSSVVNSARALLKNIAPNFTTTEYYTNRTQVASSFFNALKTGLEAEINVEVVAFQLRQIVLSSQVV